MFWEQETNRQSHEDGGEPLETEIPGGLERLASQISGERLDEAAMVQLEYADVIVREDVFQRRQRFAANVL